MKNLSLWELNLTIKQLKTEIAVCKDSNIDCSNKEKLLEEYIRRRDELIAYNNKMWTSFWIFIGVCIFIVVLVCACVYT